MTATRRFSACVLALLLSAALQLQAAEHFGQVTFAGAAVPGATVTAVQGDRQVTVTTDGQGIYRFPDLADGAWTIRVEMIGFTTARQDITVSAMPAPLSIPLTIRSFAEITQQVATVQAERLTSTPLPLAAPAAAAAARSDVPGAPPASPAADEPNAGDAADGLLINGSVNNGAASPFAQAAAFGNNRNTRRSLYNGMAGLVFGSSRFDARPHSFTSQQADKPSYTDVQFLGTFGGPIRLMPKLWRNPTNVFIGFQKNVESNATTQSALVPSALERAGNFSQSRDAFGRPVVVTDPLTGFPFAGNAIPADRLSPEALALLAYYPQANVAAAGRYNYQAALISRTDQDNLQSRLTHNINARNALTGTVSFQRTRAENTSLFGFTDVSGASTLDATGIWTRRFSPFFSTRVRYQFTRVASSVAPYFANQVNISGAAGISGNDQDPANWGPPALAFSTGLLGLQSGQFADSTALTNGTQAEALINRPGHSLTVGGGVRRQAVDALGQQNGRGSFSFTGANSGSDLGDFLLGLPRSSTIAFGNREKLLRAWNVDLFFTDDWRVTPGLTINAGVRWEYEGPMGELQGRLSNLDIAPGFTAAAVVTPAGASGALTGRSYPAALLKADRSGIQPRVGIAWRPLAGSSLVVRAGYGIYRNTNTYQSLAMLMAQQPPYSTALSVESSASAPLTLRNGFIASTAGAPATFAIDPDFRVGDAQNWQVMVQRDLPASLSASATYLGSYGRNLMQEFLPNTYPAGMADPCPSCPRGFVYLTSTGSSLRNAGQFQLRRRLRNGLTASAQYTLAKATDDAGAFTGAALSGAAIAQDWRDLDAEEGRSNFDQRHQLTAQVEYTTGVGVAGGGMLTGLRGALVKGWTVTSRLTAGSGLPLTPTYLASVAGTGVTGTLRAALSGATTAAPDGLFLNPAAYALPAPGRWGDAGRNSVSGPAQFNMSLGVARTFPWGDRMNLDWRIDATNVLNRVTYSAVNTFVGSSQFGAPTRANQMRKVQTSLRLRF